MRIERLLACLVLDTEERIQRTAAFGKPKTGSP